MTLLKTLAIAAAGLVLSFGAAQAAEGQTPAKGISFSFEGPFGTFDRAEISAMGALVEPLFPEYH